MSNIGLYEGPSYYKPDISEDSRQKERAVYDAIEDLLSEDEEMLVEHIWEQVNEALRHYQNNKYLKWAP